MKHTVIAWMEDKPGVLNRVAGLFRRRNFNIESLTVGHSETSGISRMTFVVEGDNRQLRQVQTQLAKLINVTAVQDVTDEPTVIVRARVPQSYKIALAKLGKGVVSVGIRLLIKEHLRRALDMAMAAEERSKSDV